MYSLLPFLLFSLTSPDSDSLHTFRAHSSASECSVYFKLMLYINAFGPQEIVAVSEQIRVTEALLALNQTTSGLLLKEPTLRCSTSCANNKKKQKNLSCYPVLIQKYLKSTIGVIVAQVADKCRGTSRMLNFSDYTHISFSPPAVRGKTHHQSKVDAQRPYSFLDEVF